jgi:hypothetical protein
MDLFSSLLWTTTLTRETYILVDSRMRMKKPSSIIEKLGAYIEIKWISKVDTHEAMTRLRQGDGAKINTLKFAPWKFHK